MAETSRFWDGSVTGDATVAPYDAATEFAEVLSTISGSLADVNKGSVFPDTGVGSLAPSVVAATIRIGAGKALVDGTWYKNTANVDTAIPTPGALTRIDQVVLRKSFATQTVRIFRIAGTEGAGIPPLVQTAGVTWDYPIAQASIATSGVITMTDMRTYSFKDQTPAGTVSDYAGASIPSGWLVCDGGAVSRTTYAALFTAIGTTWGVGDGSTTFNVPDLRGRVSIGVGTGAGLSARALAASGGEEGHVATVGEVGAHGHAVPITDGGHNHTQNAHNHATGGETHGHTITGSLFGTTYATGGSGSVNMHLTTGTQSTSGVATGLSISNATPTNVANTTGITAAATATATATAANVMQPYKALNKIIKY